MQQQKLAEERRRQVRVGRPLEQLLGPVGWMLTVGGSSTCSRAFWSSLGLESPPSLEQLRGKGQAERSAQRLPVAPVPLLLCRHCRRRRSGSPNAFLPSHTLMTQRASRSFSSCLTIPEWSGDSTSHSH